MNILEYSSDHNQQVIPRKSKMLEYLGYSRILKFTKAGNFYNFQALFSYRWQDWGDTVRVSTAYRVKTI